jgi:hypothetical protein
LEIAFLNLRAENLQAGYQARAGWPNLKKL